MKNEELPSLTPVEFVVSLQEELVRLLAFEEWEIDQEADYPDKHAIVEGIRDFSKQIHTSSIRIGLGENRTTQVNYRPQGYFSFENQKIIFKPLRKLERPIPVTTLSERRRLIKEARKSGLSTEEIKKMDFYKEPNHTPIQELRLPTIVLDELMRIFFRLTQYPPNSLIPLKDLIDNPADNTHYSFYRSLLACLASKVDFPFPYYPSSAVFERKDDILQTIFVIENVKAVLSGTCPHCHGNFQPSQVDAYTTGETITCEYCLHTIKAEWRSTT